MSAFDRLNLVIRSNLRAFASSDDEAGAADPFARFEVAEAEYQDALDQLERLDRVIRAAENHAPDRVTRAAEMRDRAAGRVAELRIRRDGLAPLRPLANRDDLADLEDAPALESRFAALEAESSLAALRVRAGMEPSAPVPTTEDDDVLVRLRAAMNGESR
ncbi:MAG: hypothetical protein H6698_00075 [Myxococcales bacterium]|nr:hypothetical protein [Myxococcales bacterium]MCB9532708.1 hypothetical protein [Myxococcales bacterium]